MIIKEKRTKIHIEIVDIFHNYVFKKNQLKN
jgi:hypothetical protein